MNITEYRAMVAQEAEQANSQPIVEEQPNVQAVESPAQPVEQANQTAQPGEPAPPNAPVETEAPPALSVPETIEINGEQVPLDELKNGYLRRGDYTQKTQELAREKQQVGQAQAFLEQVKANPELAKQIGFDPVRAELDAKDAQLNDLLLEREINELSAKYSDFEPVDVLNLAVEKQITNLEDAYLLNKQLQQSAQSAPQAQVQAIDVEALKAELRNEILTQLQTEQDTSTIIASNGGTAPTQPSTPQLSEQELKVAKAMGLSPDEYAKYRG